MATGPVRTDLQVSDFTLVLVLVLEFLFVKFVSGRDIRAAMSVVACGLWPHFVCFVSFVVKKKSVSICVNPWLNCVFRFILFHGPA